MTARIIASAIGGGSKLLVKVYAAMRRARKNVKQGSDVFYNTLVEQGVPKKDAKIIAKTYKSAGEEVLSIRKMIRLASRLDVV
ncbi:MAG: hypothetical protein ACTSYL_08075 [Candidatus Thorarchaeota archaeon]